MYQGVKELVNLSDVHYSEFLLRNVLRSQHGTAVYNIPGQMHKITVVMRCVKTCLSLSTHHTGAGLNEKEIFKRLTFPRYKASEGFGRFCLKN